MSASIAFPSPFPYIALAVVCIIVSIILFLKIPSLREIRKKRNLIVYAAFILILGLTVYQAYDLSLGPTVISYNLAKNEKEFYAGQVNKLNISCESLCMRETSFYLVLKSVNATLVVENQQNYIQLNSTAIKMPFTLSSVHETQSKVLSFIIDKNVANFEFYPNIERLKDFPIVTGSTRQVQCAWNSTTNSYIVDIIPGPSV
jgi:hypothetical protein